MSNIEYLCLTQLVYDYFTYIYLASLILSRPILLNLYLFDTKFYAYVLKVKRKIFTLKSK